MTTQFRRAVIDPHQPSQSPSDWAEIKDRVVAYLSQAPAIAVARSKEPDAITGTAFMVPLAIATDGTWTWPAAVDYYAQHHDIAPEPDFLDHIRANDFTLPTLTPEQLTAATQSLR